MFITILYMFRAKLCSSSGESIVSIQHLVYVTLCRWPSGMQFEKEFLPDLHTRRSPTQSDIYQTLYWYIWFSWWWARGCSKHVENWNKHIRKKNCASSWSFTRIMHYLATQWQFLTWIFQYTSLHGDCILRCKCKDNKHRKKRELWTRTVSK
jgi:hypothetical protein